MTADRTGTLRRFPGFTRRIVGVEPGAHINAVIGGNGPALLLHGYPQTLAIRQKVASRAKRSCAGPPD